MKETKKSFTKEWTISILGFEDDEGIKYKVTRSIPELSVNETKVFLTKKEALEQFNEWLEY